MKYEELLLELENNIVLCIKQIFDYLSESKIEIFAFAINISDDLAYLGFVANSISNIDNKNKWLADEFDLELSFANNKITEITKKNDDILEEIDEIVGNSFDNFDEKIYIKTKNNIIEIITNAIKKVKIQIDYEISNIVFFISMPSADDAIEIKKISSLELNDISILDDFHKTLP